MYKRQSFALLKQAEAGSVEYEVYRNATIKGFELVLETGGKLLGKYLKQFFISPAEVDRLYFKDVLRNAAKHGLLTPDEASRWFTYRDNKMCIRDRSSSGTLVAVMTSNSKDSIVVLPDCEFLSWS